MADANGDSKKSGQPRGWGERIVDALFYVITFFYALIGLALAIVAALVLVSFVMAAARDAEWITGGGEIQTFADRMRALAGGTSATLFLALVAAALSVPIVLYRAWLQRRTVVTSELNEKNTRDQIALIREQTTLTRSQLEHTEKTTRRSFDQQQATLEQQQNAARRQEQIDLRLRANEMLGATKSVQTLHWAESEEPAADGSEKSVTKRAQVALTVSTPNMEIRVAAIGILEEVAQAKDPFSDKLENHWPVMETLLAYVRTVREPLDIWAGFEAEHPEYEGWSEDDFGDLTAPTGDDGGRAEPPAEKHVAYAKARADWARKQVAEAEPPTDDVAAIIRVLQRRTPEQQAHELDRPTPVPAIGWEEGWKKFQKEKQDIYQNTPSTMRATAAAKLIKRYIDQWRDAHPPGERHRPYQLDNTPLHHAQLAGAPLRRLDLSRARMEGANLSQAQMQGATLFQAQMQGANLSWAQMQGADLSRARIQGANLSWAQMQGARLGGAQMQGANLSWAGMEGANLNDTRMEGANLRGTQMEGADLSRARIQGANLFRAQMEGANLFQARMEGASLVRAALIAHRDDDPEDVSMENHRAQAETSGLLLLPFDDIFGDKTVADQLRRLGLTPPAHLEREYEDFDEADRAWAAWRKEREFGVLPQHEKYETEG